MVNILVFASILILFGCLDGGIIAAAINLNDLYSDMALEYFETRNVTNVIMFLCWTVDDRVKIMKLFSEYGIRVAQPYVRQENFQRMKEMFRTDVFQMGVVFDVTCYAENKPSFQKYTYFNASYIWLTFDYGEFEFIKDYTASLPLSISSDAVMTKTTFVQENGTYVIELYDVYHPGFEKGIIMNITYIGNWVKGDEAANQKWKDFLSIPKVHRRRDLNGLTIKAVTFTEHQPKDVPLETYLQDEHFPYLDSVFKMNYHLIRLLSNIHNFTITLIMADNWTDKNAKGFYRSGNLIGVLSERKADVMAGAIQLMSDRLPIVDVIHMTYPFRAGFIFRYSGDFGKINLNFLRPFDGTVWIIMLSVSTVIVASVWLILIYENKYFIQDESMNFSFSDAMLSILTAWCQMGSGVRPSTYASRLVYVSLFFNSLILYNYYTSSIVSSLLSYRSQTFGIVDLADSPMRCGSFDTGYVHNLLFDIPVYPNMKYFNEKKKRDPFYFTISEGVLLVKEGDFAYHSEYSTIYSDIANTFEAPEICELQEVDTIRAVGLGVLAQKDSPYTEMFRVGFAKARETGQLKRLLDIWVAKKPVCQANKEVSEVNLYQTASMFFVLLAGHILAIMVLFYERYKWKKQNSKLSNKNGRLVITPKFLIK